MKSVMIAVAVVLAAALVFAQNSTESSSSGSGSGTTTISVGLEYLIATSYSLNATTMDCFNDNPTEDHCNNTIACYWNASLNPASCQQKDDEEPAADTTEEDNDAWCVGHFPTPVISTVYMAGAFVMGFALSGAIYNAMWYDTYSRINDVGERQFNQFYYATTPMNIYCTCIVVVCFFMFGFTFVNQFWDDQSCVYIFFSYLFIIGFFIPAVVIPLWMFIVWVMKKCRTPPKTTLTLDEWCVPLTQSCLDDPKNCQTRCF